MPKIEKPPPPGILNHLIKRYLERGGVTEADFLELKHWLESDPDVPEGKWYSASGAASWLARERCLRHSSHRAWLLRAKKSDDNRRSYRSAEARKILGRG